jgi:hypothetical protein
MHSHKYMFVYHFNFFVQAICIREQLLPFIDYLLHSVVDAIDVGPAWVRNYLHPRALALLLYSPPARVFLNICNSAIVFPESSLAVDRGARYNGQVL